MMFERIGWLQLCELKLKGKDVQNCTQKQMLAGFAKHTKRTETWPPPFSALPCFDRCTPDLAGPPGFFQ